MRQLHQFLLAMAIAAAPFVAKADFAFGTPSFAYNSATLDNTAKAILLDASVTLARMPTYKLKLYGSRGQLENDASVSRSRLNNALQFLISNGVAQDRILVEDRGASAPLHPNCARSESPNDCDLYNRNIQLQLVAP